MSHLTNQWKHLTDKSLMSLLPVIHPHHSSPISKFRAKENKRKEIDKVALDAEMEEGNEVIDEASKVVESQSIEDVMLLKILQLLRLKEKLLRASSWSRNKKALIFKLMRKRSVVMETMDRDVEVDVAEETNVDLIIRVANKKRVKSIMMDSKNQERITDMNKKDIMNHAKMMLLVKNINKNMSQEINREAKIVVAGMEVAEAVREEMTVHQDKITTISKSHMALVKTVEVAEGTEDVKMETKVLPQEIKRSTPATMFNTKR